MQELGIKLTAQGAVDVQRQLDAVQAGLGKFAAASTQAAAATKLTGYQAAQLSANLQDLFIQIQGGGAPLTALLQQGSQLSAVFGGVGNAVRGIGAAITPAVVLVGSLAAAVGGLGLAWNAGRKESEALRQAIALTGNAAGITADQFQSMAESIGQSTQAGIGAAKEAMQALVASGRVGAEALGATAKAAAALSRATGENAGDVAKRFAGMTDNVATSVAKLNQQFGFLTLEQYKSIKAMEDHGNAQGALAEAMKLFEGRVGTTVQALGGLERELQLAKNAWEAWWDGVKSIGRDKGPEEKIAELQNQILLGRQGIGSLRFDENATKQQIEYLKEQLRMDQRLAESKSKTAEASKAAIAVEGEVSAALGDQLKLRKQLVEASDRLRAAGRNESEIKAVLDQITLGSKAFANSTAESIARVTAAGSIAAARTAAELQNLNNLRRAGAVSQIEYLERTTSAEVKQLETERALLQQRRSIEGQKAAMGDESAAARLIAADAEIQAKTEQINARRKQGEFDVQQYIRDLRTKASEEYRRTLEEDEAAIAASESARLKAQSSFTEGQRQQTQSIRDAIELSNLELSLATADNEQRQIAIGQLRVRIELERRLAEIRKTEGLDPAVRAKAIADAEAEAARQSAQVVVQVQGEAWASVFKDVRSGLYEAIRDGGKDGARSLRDLFEKLVLRPLIEPQLNALSASITDVITGMRGNTGNTSFGGTGSLLGNSAGSDIGIEVFGKDIALKDAVAAAGYLDAFMSAKSGKWGTAIGEAAGAYFGGPLGAMVGKTIGAAIDRVFAGGAGTPHMGGYVSVSATGQITDITKAQGGTQQADMQALVAQLAGQLNTALVSGAKAFGVEATNSMRLVFEADGQDASWGIAQVLNAAGQQVSGFGAKGTFAADAKTGFTQFTVEAAQSVKAALLAIDLPQWASDALNSITTSDGADKLTQVVAQVVQTQTAITDLRASLRPLGVSFAELAGLSDDAVYTLMQAAGGMDSLKSGLKDYFGAYFDDSERAAMQLSAIGDELRKVGVDVLPATKEAYRALAEGQDLSTKAGAELYAALIRNAGAFAEVMDSADGAADAVKTISATLDDLQSAIDRQIGKFQTPEQAQAYGYGKVQASLAGAGVNVSLDQLLGATKQQVFDFAQAFVALNTNSLDAKLAVVNAAGALADLIDASTGAAQAVGSLSSTVNGRNGAQYGRAEFEAAVSSITAADMASAVDTYLGSRFGGAEAVPEWAKTWVQNPVTAGAMANEIAMARLDQDRLRMQDAIPTLGGQTGAGSLGQELAAEQVRATKELIDALDGVESGLRDYLDSLTQGSLSALSPKDMLADARAAFESTYSQAFSGDQAAGEAIRARADDLLRAQRAYSGSGGYAPVFDTVVQRLEALADRVDELKAETASGNRSNAAGLLEVAGAVIDGNDTSARALDAAKLERARGW